MNESEIQAFVDALAQRLNQNGTLQPHGITSQIVLSREDLTKITQWPFETPADRWKHYEEKRFSPSNSPIIRGLARKGWQDVVLDVQTRVLDAYYPDPFPPQYDD